MRGLGSPQPPCRGGAVGYRCPRSPRAVRRLSAAVLSGPFARSSRGSGARLWVTCWGRPCAASRMGPAHPPVPRGSARGWACDRGRGAASLGEQAWWGSGPCQPGHPAVPPPFFVAFRGLPAGLRAPSGGTLPAAGPAPRSLAEPFQP